MEDWALIGVRFALYADLSLLFGVPLFGLYALTSDERRSTGLVPFRPIVLLLATAGVLLSLLGFAILAATMAGVAIGDVDRDTFAMLLTETAPGWALLVRLAALLALLLAGLALPRRAERILPAVSVLAAVALASLAWSGHAVATEAAAGVAHLIGDVLHLLAAGAWLGALVALATMMLHPATVGGDARLHAIHHALAGFAWIGTLIVGAIVATGAVNGWFLVGPGHLLALADTVYGRLLLAKLALFGTMLGIAAHNRFRLTPAFQGALARGEPERALSALRRSVMIEAGLALAILALLAWLGTLEPPLSGG